MAFKQFVHLIIFFSAVCCPRVSFTYLKNSTFESVIITVLLFIFKR